MLRAARVGLPALLELELQRLEGEGVAIASVTDAGGARGERARALDLSAPPHHNPRPSVHGTGPPPASTATEGALGAREAREARGWERRRRLLTPLLARRPSWLAGRTALHLGAEAGGEEVCELLLEEGDALACCRAGDAEGATPLHLAAQVRQAQGSRAQRHHLRTSAAWRCLQR